MEIKHIWNHHPVIYHVHLKSKWMFPKIVVPPNHPLKNRGFHYIHHPFWGKHPYFWKPPNDSPKTKLPQHAWKTTHCFTCQVSCDYEAQGNWDIVGAALEKHDRIPMGNPCMMYLHLVDFDGKYRLYIYIYIFINVPVPWILWVCGKKGDSPLTNFYYVPMLQAAS